MLLFKLRPSLQCMPQMPCALQAFLYRRIVQKGKTTYIVRVHFSETAKETMEDKIKRMLREEVRKM